MVVVFFVCLAMHVIVNVSVWDECWLRLADVVYSCHECISCKLLELRSDDLQFVDAGPLVGDTIGNYMDEAYSRDGQPHDCLKGGHECHFLFSPCCSCECIYNCVAMFWM